MIEKSTIYQLIPVLKEVVEEKGIFTVDNCCEDFVFYSFRTRKPYYVIFSNKALCDFSNLKLLTQNYGDQYFATITMLKKDAIADITCGLQVCNIRTD